MSTTTTSSTTSLPSGTTGAGGGNMLRITGMASGLDIDSMVTKMLAGDQAKIDKVKQQQQTVTWKQQAYQQIITDIKSLQSTYFDVTNQDNFLLTPNNYNNLATSSTYTSVATATAKPGAAAGSYTLQVDKVATAATIGSSSSLNSQLKVSDISNWYGKTISLSVGGGANQVITLPNSGNVTDLVSSINNQITGNVSLSGKLSASVVSDSTGSYIKFTPLTSNAVQITGTTVANNEIPTGSLNTNLTSASLDTPLTSLGVTGLNANLTLNLSYNGTTKTVTLDNSSSGKNGSATIGDLVTAINTATGGQVTGNFDDMTGNFTLQTTNTGSTASLAITGDNMSGALLSALKLPVESKTGTDTQVEITPPGSNIATTLTEASNNFTVNGISYSVTGTGSTNISVTSDTQKIHDMIKGFVDKYNSIVDEIQTQLGQKSDPNYPPLTDAQKSQMSDTDITNWNNKAQQGVLNNDTNLENLLTSLRQAFTTPLTDSSGNNITSLFFGKTGSGAIGIDTSDDYTQGDKISIVDDSKLNDAIAQHGDQIMKLFTNISTSTNTTTNYNESGIFQRINTIIQNNVGIVGTTLNSATLTKYANLQDDYSTTGIGGSNTLPNQIYEKQLLINTLTTQMSSDQTKYYNQFTAMETAINNLNTQQSIISQEFGG